MKEKQEDEAGLFLLNSAMKYFKIENFEQERPGERFPQIKVMSPDSVTLLSQKIDPLVRSVPTMMLTLDSSLDTFSPKEIWGITGIAPADSLYLSFDPLQSIDVMKKTDFENNFSYIWYAGTDDLYLFDDSALWLVFINHGGCIFVTMARHKDKIDFLD